MAAAKTKQQKGIERTLVKVIAHPLRVQALSVLAERPASPKEIAAELGAQIGNVSYHVRALEEVGLVELVDEKKRRGAVEHFYRAIARPLIGKEEWAELDLEERQSLSIWTLQLILADAAQSLGAGTFDARADRHLSRTPLLVDERGWRELVEIQARALEATLQVQAASAERMSHEGGEDGFPAFAAMTCFEMPDRRRAGP